MKFVGKVRPPCARLMVTVPFSSGCRNTFSLCWPNSGISSAELRFSLEEHAAVRQADTCPTAGAGLAGPRPLAATDQPRVRDGVMRCAEGAVADQRDVAGTRSVPATE